MKKLKKTSDEELLNLYQSNSEENLLNILLQRHMPQIRQNVRSLVCNKEDVEDLCQDIYSRILIKLRQGYYSNGHIQAWIYRIVQNYVYSFYRKKKHEFITQELTDLNIGDTWSDTIKEEKEKERILYTPIRDKIAISCIWRQIHEFSSHAIRHELYIKNRKRLFCP